MNLEVIIQLATLITFSAGTIKYLIVQPIQSSLEILKETLTKLEVMLEKLECDQLGMIQRLVIVEQSIKAAHKRLDTMDAVKQLNKNYNHITAYEEE